MVAWRSNDCKTIAQFTGGYFKCQLNNTAGCLQTQQLQSRINHCQFRLLSVSHNLVDSCYNTGILLMDYTTITSSKQMRPPKCMPLPYSIHKICMHALTLSVPHFGKNESKFLTFRHSGSQDCAPVRECQKIKKGGLDQYDTEHFEV